MQSLRNNILVLILVLTTGCSTLPYQVKSDSWAHEISVSPKRIGLECEYIDNYTGDIPEAHGFMIHVLDKNNTVVTIIQGNILGKDDCFF